MQALIYGVLKLEGRALTDNELAACMTAAGVILVNHKENVRKRRAELFKKGFVRFTYETRACEVTGKQAQTWRAR